MTGRAEGQVEGEHRVAERSKERDVRKPLHVKFNEKRKSSVQISDRLWLFSCVLVHYKSKIRRNV